MVLLKPQGGGVAVVVVSSVFIPLPILFTTLRIWARIMKRRSLEINDYAILVALILSIANAILTILAVVRTGVGQHIQYVLPHVQELQKITLALALIWTTANTAVKISILHLYITIFRKRSFRYAAYAVMALSAIYCLLNWLLILLTCRPVAFSWDKTIPGGVCSSHEIPYLSSAIVNVLTDVIIVALPMPVLWKLQLPTRKKVALSVIFGLGALICILSAIRVSSIAALDYNDFTHSVVPDAIYSVLEPCLGVINASLPILQPVASRIAKSRVYSYLLYSMPTSFGFSKGAGSTPKMSRSPIGSGGQGSGNSRTTANRTDECDEAAGKQNFLNYLAAYSPGAKTQPLLHAHIHESRFEAVCYSKGDDRAQKNDKVEITTSWDVQSRDV